MKKPTLKKVKVSFGIIEYHLSNGLRILYRRETAAPVVAVCITFHVGSRNETPGHTGSTHILEHLLFKDTKKYNRKNKKELATYLEFLGADLNATTWLDRTNYFELVPKRYFAEAIAVEADRMRGSLFGDEDLKTEMVVVRNEYERSRNNPFELLDEAVMAQAFVKHPYRISTIGTKEDIEGATVAKLREFYDTFYWPNNATLTIFGDVSEREMRQAVLRQFGPLKSSPKPVPQMEVTEPKQKQARSAELSLPLGVQIASLSYKIPAGVSADFPAVLALSMVLGGGFSSRLQKALVDTGLAADIMVSCPALHDEGVVNFVAHVAEGKSVHEVVAAIRSVAEDARDNPPAQRELARVKERILAQSAFERDGAYLEARTLSESIAAGDWSLGYRLEQAVQKLKERDLQDAARKYFVKTSETAGTLADSSESTRQLKIL